MVPLGEKVRRLLALRSDISQADLARALGVSQQAVAKMVSPKNPQKQSKHVSKLARFFHTTVEMMEDERWDPKREPPPAYMHMPSPSSPIRPHRINASESTAGQTPEEDGLRSLTTGEKPMRTLALSDAVDAILEVYSPQELLVEIISRRKDTKTLIHKRNRGR